MKCIKDNWKRKKSTEKWRVMEQLMRNKAKLERPKRKKI